MYTSIDVNTLYSDPKPNNNNTLLSRLYIPNLHPIIIIRVNHTNPNLETKIPLYSILSKCTTTVTSFNTTHSYPTHTRIIKRTSTYETYLLTANLKRGQRRCGNQQELHYSECCIKRENCPLHCNDRPFRWATRSIGFSNVEPKCKKSNLV